MNQALFVVLGQPITISTILAVIAVVQFIAIAAWSGLSKAKFAKTGSRPSEVALLVSSCVLFAVWAFVFDAVGAVRAAKAGSVVEAPAVSAHESPARASCASLAAGMKAPDVRKRMGEPDQVVNEADVRGNGAAMWVYADRCSVHVFEGKVEFVE